MVRTISTILGTTLVAALLCTVPAAAVPVASSIGSSAPVPSPEAASKGVKYGHGAPMGWSNAPTTTATTLTSPGTRAQTFAATASTLTPGIDVSAYATNNINWAGFVANGRKFAFLKATEGTYYTSNGDTTYPNWFSNQWKAATASGILRGAYHFANPKASNPGGAAQADFFIANGGGWTNDGQTLPGVLDIETNPYTNDGTNGCYNLTPAQMVAWIAAFSNEYQAKTGVYPIIYTGINFWNACTGGSTAFNATNPFWISYYYYSGNSTAGPGAMPNGIPQWSFWQYNNANGGTGTPMGVVPGTDYDQFNGSYCQLLKFTTRPTSASGYTASGYKPGGAVGVGTGPQGVQEIYTVDGSSCLKTEWQTAPDGDWSNWLYWGSGYTPGAAIAVGRSVNAIQQVYLVDANGHLQTRWQTAPGGTWTNWVDWGAGYTPGAAIGVGRSPSGAQQIYLVDANQHLLTKWQTAPGGTWTNWVDWGGGYQPGGTIGVGFGPQGVQQIYLVDANGHLQTRWQTAPGGNWTNWVDWGAGYTPGTPIGVGGAPNNVQEIYYVAANGHVQTKWQTGPGAGWTNGWFDMGGNYPAGSAIGVGAGASGAQQLYLVDANGNLTTSWQVSPGGTWTNWQLWAN